MLCTGYKRMIYPDAWLCDNAHKYRSIPVLQCTLVRQGLNKITQKRTEAADLKGVALVLVRNDTL